MALKFNPFTGTFDYVTDPPVTSVNGQTGDVVVFRGLALITVSNVAPTNPGIGDLWVDTS